MNKKSAITAINKAGALLVFPLDNRKEPASIWSYFYPRTPMRWEWDEDGDDRVATLWHLRGELSTTRQVVYTKWFRGRATYFSKELFTALLRSLNPLGTGVGLSTDARNVLTILEGESPLSTKELKRQSGLQGRASERQYERALKELWSRLLVVAYGEVEDGAFPSLAVGATRVIFEDLWNESARLELGDAEKRIAARLPEDNLFLRHYRKLKESVAPKPAAKRGSGKSKAVRSEVSFEDLA